MSGTDLGQSWLMCPQLPGGFWSGGSNACSLTMNTNAEYYGLLLLHSTLNGSHQNNMKTGRMAASEFANTESDNHNSWLSPCASCCVNTTSCCVCAGLVAVREQLANAELHGGVSEHEAQNSQRHMIANMVRLSNGQPAAELPICPNN